MKAILFFLCASLVAGQGLARRDDSAVRSLIDRYLAARQQSSAAEVRELFSGDADQLVSTGEWRRGREAVVAGVLKSSQSNEGKRTITIETIRKISATVALADGRYEIAPAAGAPRKMWTSFLVVKESGGWRIAAIRNMLPAPARR